MTLSSLPLSYCTNVHPGRTVTEVISGITDYTAEIHSSLEFPLAAGLWLPESAVRELREQPESLERLAQSLWQHDLCCYTLNTFPFGDFHSERVKEQVYLPDWADTRRVVYTEDCATLLSLLLPEGAEGSLSTVPLGGRMNPHGADFHALCFSHLIRMARHLREIHETTGRLIRLGLEPEPLCELSGTEEWTLPTMTRLFEYADVLNCESLVREYIGICFDVCHQAVEFEDVADSIRKISRHGIRINKIHLTNALEIRDPAHNAAGREALSRYVEPRYLHQTFAELSDGSVQSRPDLLENDIFRRPPDAFLEADRWRVHFHVPIFAETIGPLNTTRQDLAAAIRAVAELDYAPHLEVETYTWPVMLSQSQSQSQSPESEPGDQLKSSVTDRSADAANAIDTQSLLSQRIARELRSAAELLSSAGSE